MFKKVGEMSKVRDAGGAASVVFGGPVSWVVVVVFKFASDGSIAYRSKWTFGKSSVFVVKLR